MRGTLTGKRYVDDILRPHVGPFLNGLPGAIFQQDNARPHTARVAEDFLRHFQTGPWPAHSPDLSPVEHPLEPRFQVDLRSTVASDEGPRDSSQQRARFVCLSLALALSTIQGTVRFCSFPPQFCGRTTLGVVRSVHLSFPSTNLTRGLAVRRLFRVPPLR
ncbi:transposable element Tcb1 transposase [Trichonephila clavipes]|nr:transposable element Tcb1 transposase [Trichonephila clavipes]